MKNLHTYGTWLLMLLVGGVLGAFVMSAVTESKNVSLVADVRDRFSNAEFTNPLLECAELPESISIGQRIGLENAIEEFVDAERKRGNITTASIYFRDLNNGPWFGVNEDLKFYPASLLKIPLAMWYYWRADIDPALLDRQVEFTGPLGTSYVYFPPKTQLVVGETYTVEQLLSTMLQESENDAAKILDTMVDRSETARVYADLGVDPGSETEPYEVDVRTYSAFFRVLYNATYLGRTLSEHMLETMSYSSFKSGIVAGVPQSVRVSHKFGEKQLNTDGTEVQLHDCGIIYAESPYILCVMSQGTDMESLATFIAAISQQVYSSL